MNPLQKFYTDKAVREALKELFEQCANEQAVLDMDKGVDVSYVPKNKAIFRLMYSKLDEAFGEKKPKPERKSRAR